MLKERRALVHLHHSPLSLRNVISEWIHRLSQGLGINPVSTQYALHNLKMISASVFHIPTPLHDFGIDPTPSPSPEPERSYRMDATPSPSPPPELGRTYRMDATPSLPASTDLLCSYGMDGTPSPPPSTDLVRSYGMDATPSPPPSTGLVRSYRMDATRSPPPSTELVRSYRMDATLSPPPSTELVRSYRIDATPSLPSLPKLGHSYRMDATPPPPLSLNDPLCMDTFSSPESQNDSGTQGPPFPNPPLFGSSSNGHCKLYICSYYIASESGTCRLGMGRATAISLK
jgi:hypothetical protein